MSSPVTMETTVHELIAMAVTVAASGLGKGLTAKVAAESGGVVYDLLINVTATPREVRH